MADFDELRLKIALDDRASAGLAKIRSEIVALGDYNLRLSRQFQGQTLQLTQVMRPLISGSLASRQALYLLGRQYGPTAVMAGGLGYAAIAMTSKLSAFSEEVIRVGARAKALGVSGGEFAGLTKQLVDMGFSQPQAQKFLTSYYESMIRLSDASGEFRTQLLRSAGTASGDTADWIERQLGFFHEGKTASGLNEWRRGIINNYQEALNDPRNIGGEPEAARVQATQVRDWGNDPELFVKLKGDLTDITDQQKRHWTIDEASASRYAQTLIAIREKFDDFNKGRMSTMAVHFGRIAKRFETGEINADRWGRVVGANFNQILLKLVDFTRAVNRFVEYWKSFIAAPKGPEPVVGLNFGQGMPSQNFWEVKGRPVIATQPAGATLGGASPVPISFQEGGIVTQPTLAMLGEAGPEAVVPLKGGDLTMNMGFVNRLLEQTGTKQPLMEALPTLIPSAVSVAAEAAHMVGVPGAGLISIAADLFGAGADIGIRGAEKALSKYEMQKYAPLGGPILSALEGSQTALMREDVQGFMKDYLPENVVNEIVGFSTAEVQGPQPRGVLELLRSVFSRQYGGPVDAGQEYLVGEAGPETFVPRGSERDMRQNIYETRDNREALQETERPNKSLADELRTLNDWMETKVGVGAPGRGKIDVVKAMGEGYGISGGWGSKSFGGKLDSDVGPDFGGGGRGGGGGASRQWQRMPSGDRGVGPGSGPGAGESEAGPQLPSGRGGGRTLEHGSGNIKGVDPRLMHILQEAAKDLPEGWRVQVRSGKDARGKNTSMHPRGFAIDIALMDPEGSAKYGNKIIGNLGRNVRAGKGWVPWLQSPEAYKTYEHFAYIARKHQQKLYPELNNKFAWGGWFGRRNEAFMDLMHFSTGGEGGSAGSWEKGLKPEYVREWGIDQALPSQIKYDESAQERTESTPAREQVREQSKDEGGVPQKQERQLPQGTGGSGGGIRSVLANQRQRIKEELAANPQLRQRMVQLAQAENAKSPQHIMETMVNRAITTGKTLRQTIDPNVSPAARAYYAPYHKGGARYAAAGRELAAGAQASVNAMVDDVLAGSNKSNLATHHGSQGVGARAKARGEHTAEAGGEVYYRKDKNAERHGEGVVKREKRWAEETAKAAADRKEIDGAMGTEAKSGTAKGDVTLTTNVKAPDGTTVTAKGEGAVTTTEVNRAKKGGKLETASTESSEKEAA